MSTPEIRIVPEAVKAYQSVDRAPAQQAARRVRPKVFIFNPTDYPDDVFAGGRTYHFAPEEITGIMDMTDYPWEDNPNGTRKYLKGSGRKYIPEGCDAAAIAEMILDERAARCYVILEGTPSFGPEGTVMAPPNWPAQMIEARERWIEARRGEVTNIILQWEQTVAARTANGLPIPLPGKIIKRAYSDRDKYASIGEPALDVCPICGERDKSLEAINKHIAKVHPEKAEGLFRTGAAFEGRDARVLDTRAVPVATTMVTEVPKRPEDKAALEKIVQDLEPSAEDHLRDMTPGEEPVPDEFIAVPESVSAGVKAGASMTPQQAAENLIARASLLSIRLTPNEQKRLMAGDKATYQAVAAKVETASENAPQKR